jgi:hypothetical protein
MNMLTTKKIHLISINEPKPCQETYIWEYIFLVKPPFQWIKPIYVEPMKQFLFFLSRCKLGGLKSGKSPIPKNDPYFNTRMEFLKKNQC